MYLTEDLPGVTLIAMTTDRELLEMDTVEIVAGLSQPTEWGVRFNHPYGGYTNMGFFKTFKGAEARAEEVRSVVAAWMDVAVQVKLTNQ